MTYKKKLSELIRYSHLSVSFFNNTLSLRYNLIYYVYWTISKLKFSQKGLRSIVSPKLNLPPSGYQVISKAISDDVAEELSNRISAHKVLNPDFFESKLSYHSRLLYPLRTLGVTIEELFSNREVIDAVKNVLGSNFRVVWIDCYRTMKVGEEESQESWLWHTDNTPVGSLKCMIALTDISIKNGAMSYLNRDLTLANRKSGYHGDVSSNRSDNLPLTDKRSQLLTATKGSFILFDNNNLHKANIPHSGFRDVMTCLIIPSGINDRGGFSVSINPDYSPGPFPTNPFLEK